jgi:L-arabinonolactonase
MDCDCVLRIEATCGESPMWSVLEQVLYWTDNLGKRIHRLEPESGSVASFAMDRDVMDIGLRKRRGLVLALTKQLALYQPQSGELDVLMDVERDRPHNRFNDGKVDRRRRYSAGTMGDEAKDVLAGLDGGDPVAYRPRVGLDRDGGKESAAWRFGDAVDRGPRPR